MTVKKSIYLAPMVGWSTPLFREFVQVLNKDVITFTEMIVAKSLIYGNQYERLRLNSGESNVICQLAGSEPDELKSCLENSAFDNFIEINLNVGCPSTKVQKGKMGACLMKNPSLVAECLDAMTESGKKVSVKCRLGVDDQSFDDLCNFIDTCKKVTGKFYLHARYALLNGINPKQNRSIPKIDYDAAKKVAGLFPDVTFVLNGEINTDKKALGFLNECCFEGVMIGRSAYQNPWLFTQLSQESDSIRINRISEFLLKLMSSEKRDAEWLRVLSTLTHGMPKAKSMRRDIAADKNAQLEQYAQRMLTAIKERVINQRYL